MKHAILTYSVLFSAAFAFAAGFAAQPESSVPTPAEKSEMLKETPDLGAKESADWQRLRAERRVAREQILSKLRESSKAEKQGIRKGVLENRNEKSRLEGESPKKQPHERSPFCERPDSPNQNPMREPPKPPDPAPKGDHLPK
ncbi:MAG: hypothetical protein MJY82_05040 [Fibrobacter sp.]|nr:hypothetical protein [Fibrobacter sp.]